MSFARNHRSKGGIVHNDRWSSFNRNNRNRSMNMNKNYNYSHNWNRNNVPKFSGRFRGHINNGPNYVSYPSGASALKRRKFNAGAWEGSRRYYPQPNTYGSAAPSTDYNSIVPPMRGNAEASTSTNTYGNVASSNYYNSIVPPMRGNAKASTSTSNKRDHSKLEEDETVFMSRDEIEKFSPSRKDGIDALRETHLRYSYCAFIRNLGMWLELPQTTIGTAMVLCHRFFVRRSHACHDRYLIATAGLFLAAKSEETPRPLNDVLRASSEIFHNQDVAYLMHPLHIDWFERYRERVIEAEQMILTTLNFELSVQHPYGPLTCVLGKLGYSQTVLVNLALSLVSEGVYTKISVLACMILLAGGLFGVLGKCFLPLKTSKFSVASVQTPSYCCWCCLSCCQVPKFGSCFLPECLAGISNDTINSTRCGTAVDGAILVR